jgi:hypothetical protein
MTSHQSAALESARDLFLSERKEAAETVVRLAALSGWFTDDELEAAIENSSLRPDFVKKLDAMLDGYRSENRGVWPLGAELLKRAFDGYCALDIDALAFARGMR